MYYIQKEDLLKARYANDNKFGRNLYWGKVWGVDLSSKPWDGPMMDGVYRGLFGRVLKASSPADIESFQPVSPC